MCTKPWAHPQDHKEKKDLKQRPGKCHRLITTVLLIHTPCTASVLLGCSSTHATVPQSHRQA